MSWFLFHETKNEQLNYILNIWNHSYKAAFFFFSFFEKAIKLDKQII